jgi:hypothetical protein
VIDTNVLVSSLIQKNYPYLILNDFFDKKFIVCVSDAVFNEYYEVLARPKFAQFHDFFVKAEILLAQIESLATKYTPTVKLELISDVDDNKFIELAHTCKADFLITGNTKDFTFENYKKTKIVTPKDYWENHKNYI